MENYYKEVEGKEIALKMSKYSLFSDKEIANCFIKFKKKGGENIDSDDDTDDGSESGSMDFRASVYMRDRYTPPSFNFLMYTGSHLLGIGTIL
jgi:hypothetical protein